MTDQELARALFNAGLLTQEQVQSAAAQRSAGRNFAQTVVELGWLTPDQITAIDPNAFTVSGSTSGGPSLSKPSDSSTAPPPWQSSSNPIPGASSPYPPAGSNPYGGNYGNNSPAPRPATVDLSAISEAWSLVQAQMGTWVAAVLIVGVISFAVQLPFSLMAGGTQTQIDPNNPMASVGAGGASAGLQIISSIVNFVVSAFFTAGLYKMALNQIDGKPIAVGDIFSGGAVFGNVLLGNLLYTIAICVGVLACCVGAFVAIGGLAFTLPLIVDGRAGPADALSRSWNTLKSQIGSMIVLLIVAGLCVIAGALACGVGVLITYPIGLLAPVVVYRRFFPSTDGAAPSQGGTYPPPPIPSPF